MTKPKLIYFDAPVSRGEECRLALHVAGVDFDDVRIKREDWPALKPKTPFGSLPVFELPGKPPLAHSNDWYQLTQLQHQPLLRIHRRRLPQQRPARMAPMRSEPPRTVPALRA
jgi:glutathione S-transferase